MRNFIKAIFLALFVISVLSCQNQLDDVKNSALETRSRAADNNAKIKIYMYYPPKDSTDWNIWAWKIKSTGNENYSSKVWPGDLAMTKGAENEFIYELNVDKNFDLGFLFVRKAGKPQTEDIIINKEELIACKSYYIIYGLKDVYESKEACQGLKRAEITSEDGKSLKLSIFGAKNATKDSFVVMDKEGKTLKVSTVQCDDTSATLTLAEGDLKKIPYTIKYGEVSVSATIIADLIDTLGWVYDEDDLGLTLSGGSATFKLWSPLAKSVNVLLYDSVDKVGNFKKETVDANASGSCSEIELKGEPSKIITMEKDNETGVWTAKEDNCVGKFYKYEIEQTDGVFYVADIYSKSCSPDSIASEIVDINSGTSYGTVTNYKNPFKGNYSDAVIYEMHIRDWSRAFKNTSLGKFKDITDELGGNGRLAKHLKDLGVTHVQILPMFDYAQVVSDSGYNWGYNPYHYNVPEGRYVNYSTKSGQEAVAQMREMIKAFQEQNIAVIMDVVYNHTASIKGGSLYDSTVPEYYYRVSNGSYSNGSGCGNETASNHKMFKKYMIDSLKHWMLDYHINGFRFDLMGVHEQDTMKEIYDELYKIDNKVMVYGEPWTGGGSEVKNGMTGAVETASGYGVGAFDDDFRDALKGTDGFGGFTRGQLIGNFNETSVMDGLLGKSGKNKRGVEGKPGLSLHYVECHDNYTLFDKIVYATNPEIKGEGEFAPKFAVAYQNVMSNKNALEKVKNQVKLAGAFIILSQGTPFFNGGQEFMRTKKGNPDSYSADKKGGIEWTNEAGVYNIDDCNTIDLSMKEKYIDVYNTYKGLIALRKSNKAFTDGDLSVAKKIEKGIILYTAKSSSSNDEFNVIFNSTDKDFAVFDLPQSGSVIGLGIDDTNSQIGFIGKKVDISNGNVTIDENDSITASVPANSFVILKK